MSEKRKIGRPKKAPEELVKNQLIAIDHADYKKIKVESIESNVPIKVIIHKLVKKL